MPLVIKKGTGWPSGGYPFIDTLTGKNFDGMSADLALQTRNVIAHRKANPRLYPPSNPIKLDPISVRQEIVDFICAKNPSLCMDSAAMKSVTTTTNNFTFEQPNRTCPKCNARDFSPLFCKSCSGNRIVGFKCNKCSHEVDK